MSEAEPGREEAAAARRCLDSMALHFSASGGVWTKTALDVTHKLRQFNTWGSRGREKTQVTLYDLLMAWRERINEMEAAPYLGVTTAYREELHLGRLIEAAIVGVEEQKGVTRLEGQAVATGTTEHFRQ